jgi:phenylalanyl-tRNA synthetase beta chain
MPEQWGVPDRFVDFYDIKSDLEALLGSRASELVCQVDNHPALHPGRSARLLLSGREIGWLGEVHPQWVQQLELARAPVVFEVDVDAISNVALPTPTEVSRQPVVIRDLAIWVDQGVSYQGLLDTLKQTIASDAKLKIIKDIRLFDVWRDKNTTDASAQTSLALRFWLQDPVVTLGDQQVEECMQLLLQALVDQHGVRQRA